MAIQSEIRYRLDKTVLDPKELMMRLPKVGQMLYRTPTVYISSDTKQSAQLCRVTYVNKERLWYEVEFTAANGVKYKESYKLPFSMDSIRESVSGGIFV